ncbi:Uma2 family endonuclease [Desulfoferrobacter suflitae]|uniref:Uma2 family endonuclease n=1 Tax=Desulfoferrobacter suflitae TaxID=2865782 RepID=UPI002164E254|nr:Uma2 family endonuclease [Desulfoferrobacter suflitae]MCK8604443.1 Uma2 family endonuclease [Desulfoferrobacter suflitae]
MSFPAQSRYTAEQYLELERRADYKSEFINGQIYAMSGANRIHNQITFNLAGLLHSQLRGRPCEAYVADMRVKISSTGMYAYPDVAALCGDALFEDTHLDTLINPTLIIEVLSPSTEAYDRGGKFAHYRKIQSLIEYVLIAQDRYSVERFLRQEDQWLFSESTDLSGVVHLQSIECDLSLRDIYDKVAIPDDAE